MMVGLSPAPPVKSRSDLLAWRDALLQRRASYEQRVRAFQNGEVGLTRDQLNEVVRSMLFEYLDGRG